MGQIVLRTRKVAEAKVARGIRKTVEEDEAITPVDSIVEVWEDGVVPTSTVAALYKIIKVPGLGKAELDEALRDIEFASYKVIGKNEVTVWRPVGSSDDWKEVKVTTKRLRSFANLTYQDLLDLTSIGISKAAKVTILQTCGNLLTEKPENQTPIDAEITIG